MQQDIKWIETKFNTHMPIINRYKYERVLSYKEIVHRKLSGTNCNVKVKTNENGLFKFTGVHDHTACAIIKHIYDFITLIKILIN
jgi:hypothetical protein